MKLFGCTHEFDAIDLSGKHQLCKKCGIAIAVPCKHHWEVFSSWDITSDTSWSMKGRKYVLRCTECGDFKNHNVG